MLWPDAPPKGAPDMDCFFGRQRSLTRRTPPVTGFLMVGRVGLEPTTC